MSVLSRLFSRIVAVCVLPLVLSACVAANPDLNPADGIYDPFETANRKTHAINRQFDQNFVRPIARGYTQSLPDGVEDSIGHFATNLGRPSDVVNGLLQGDLRGAGISTVRFLLNSTFGVAGLFDIATDMGLPDHDTDFGETLHVWGADEGPFVELPLLGPSTQRDAYGRVVDLFTNPLSYVLGEPESYYVLGTRVGQGLRARGRFMATIDSVLYDSADSYSQARLIYMQNRRFELGEEDASSEIDPFELDTSGF